MKWLSRLLTLMLTMILVCALTVLTTGYVVNTYIQSLMKSFNISWKGQPSGLGDVLQGVTGKGGTKADSKTADQITKSKTDPVAGSQSNKIEADPTTPSASMIKPSGSSGIDGKSNEPHSPTSDEQSGQTPPKDALPVMGSTDEESKAAEDKIVISPEDLATMKKELPDQDKEEVFNMLMSKLPQKEMQSITAMLEGGITESEFIQIQQMMSTALNKEEYAKVMKILKK
ncbi:hypothetical protein J2Z69_003396 [Paenibacillus shirakamiensis]|uniref:Magnesium transporter MgtE intracellular domain-containing protein n=1 Tax=Paenibacillus shirakamiensis TaxID=1265935 RepID=A0ABS4JKT0_9BACL|nr:hypothetical protein [Paenibacillus shirakamiensis]MBP2002324.1 hypothetical protein [Paenibacillus shirakamiensis]